MAPIQTTSRRVVTAIYRQARPLLTLDGRGGTRDRAVLRAWELLAGQLDRRGQAKQQARFKPPTAHPPFTPAGGFRDPSFYRSHITDELLAFWCRHAVDGEHGGFFTHLDRTGRVDAHANKNTAMQARMVYAFSVGYALTGNQLYLQLAQHGVTFLLEHIWDSSHGGWYEEVRREGAVENAKKSTYTQSYVIIGLAEYCSVTHDTAVRPFIEQTIFRMDRFAWDAAHDGYFWACDQAWNVIDDTKSICAQLDMMMAEYGLSALGGTGEHPARLVRLADLIAGSMQDRHYGGTLEDFTRDWIYDPYATKDRLLIGHTLKAAWLFLKAYSITGQPEYLAHARDWLEYSLRHGWDDANGGFYQYVYRNGALASTTKEWWPECEGLQAFALAGKLTGEKRYWTVFDRLAAFTFNSFWDREYGEWVLACEPNGAVRDARKGCHWKAAYHTVQACYEVMQTLE
jgi:mannobiose 2-epimerase